MYTKKESRRLSLVVSSVQIVTLLALISVLTALISLAVALLGAKLVGVLVIVFTTGSSLLALKLSAVARRASLVSGGSAPEEVVDLVADLAAKAGVIVEKVNVFSGDSRAAGFNARWFTTGSRRGVVNIGTSLLAYPSVLEGIIAHELGHGRLRHQVTRHALTLAFRWLTAVLLVISLGSSFETVWLLVAGSLLVSTSVRALHARWQERQADAFALELVGVEAVRDVFELFERENIGVD